MLYAVRECVTLRNRKAASPLGCSCEPEGKDDMISCLTQPALPPACAFAHRRWPLAATPASATPAAPCLSSERRSKGQGRRWPALCAPRRWRRRSGCGARCRPSAAADAAGERWAWMPRVAAAGSSLAGRLSSAVQAVWTMSVSRGLRPRHSAAADVRKPFTLVAVVVWSASGLRQSENM